MLRTCVICCALVGVLSLAVGCNLSKDTKATPTKKEEAVTLYKSDLDKVEKQISDLKTKAEKAAGEEKTKLEAKLKEASTKRDAAKKKLEELEKAASDKWEAVSKEAKTAVEDLEKAVKEERGQ